MKKGRNGTSKAVFAQKTCALKRTKSRHKVCFLNAVHAAMKCQPREKLFERTHLTLKRGATYANEASWQIILNANAGSIGISASCIAK